jgi:hypothetical protein
MCSIWCLDMAHRLKNEEHFPESPLLQAPSYNSTKLHRLPYRYSQWQSSPRLPRSLTRCEHTLAMRLLMIIGRICRKNGIKFMMCDGTLLGSLRHHDIIPWDDDLDVMIPFEDRIRFLNLLKQMNSTPIQYNILGGEKNRYYKLSFKHTLSAGGYSWNFPFLDVFLYVTNKTHVWGLSDPDNILEIRHVFPLVMRPLGELWLPAPRKSRRLYDFNAFDNCKGHFYNHRREAGMRQVFVKCDDLKHIYPFVERDNQSGSTEILKINDTIIHTIIYD